MSQAVIVIEEYDNKKFEDAVNKELQKWNSEGTKVTYSFGLTMDGPMFIAFINIKDCR